jgi:3-deoxy-7-phosphoheptulonate synthase
MSEKWTPTSWRGKPVAQVPVYPNEAALVAVERLLSLFPPRSARETKVAAQA